MNRLTEKHYNGDGAYMVCSESCDNIENCGSCQESARIVDRLAAYENTGLTPEECAEYAQSKKEGRYIMLKYRESEGVKRLRDISEADLKGRLAVLPCRIGDTVYVAGRERTERYVAMSFAVYESYILINASRDGGETSRIVSMNKTCFLTKEEAEAALRAKEKRD